MGKMKKPPVDSAFPQLETVLDEPRFRACLQTALATNGHTGAFEVRSVKLKRIYYKPGRSCRLRFTARFRTAQGERGEQLYFGKIMHAPKSADTYARARHGSLVTPRFGPPVALLRELSMVLWAFPNDPNLPGLGTLTDRDAVTDLVQRDPQAFGLEPGGELVSLHFGVSKYVPGQRCGYRYRVTWRTEAGTKEHHFYGKAYRPGDGQQAFRIMQQLESSEACTTGRLRVPATYGFDAKREILWQEMLPGVPFSKEATIADLTTHAGGVARALGAFHATALDLGPGLGLQQEQEELANSVRRIGRAYPQHAARASALHARLQDVVENLPEVPLGPVHGSFKMSHIFDIGDEIAFIDFDGAGLGDPTYDVGRFLAHLAVAGLQSKSDAKHIEKAIQCFRDAYADAVPWGWPEKRVLWYTSALLLSSQAYKCVKRMVPDRVDAILGLAEAWCPEP